jgi:hypothetical protein
MNFKIKANKVHNNKYSYDKVIYKNNKTSVMITCPIHGDFLQTIGNHIYRKSGCPKCSRTSGNKKQSLTTIEVIKRSKVTHGNKYNYSQTIYKNSSTKIKVKCNRHGIFKQYPHDHMHGSGCPKCMLEINSKRLSHSRDDFIKKATARHGDRYKYSKVIYKNQTTPVKIICKIHGVFEQTPKLHLMNGGCRSCGIESKRDTKEDFIKKAKKVHGDKYNYDKVNYINTRTKVDIICHKHGLFKQTPNAHLGVDGCPVCNESKGEKKISIYLDSKKLKYIREYKLPNTNYRYDFYLPELNMLIEYDGEQHFRPVDYWGGLKRFKEILEADKNKNILAKLHNMTLIRVGYKKYDTLNKYLDRQFKRYVNIN